MSDKNSPDDDVQQAVRLEQIHEKMLGRKSDMGQQHETRTDDSAHEQLLEACEVLELIEQVKQERAVDQGLETAKVADTLANERPSQDDFSLEVQRIGRFEIVEQVGRGGYGMVFRARDPEIDRDVALKVPRPEVIATEEMQQRFVREAKAAGALSHPNIVTVFESGTENGVFYIASEFVPGQTLGNWIKKQSEPVDFNAAPGLIATLADAVQHAHSRGVTHRDLKPANVLLEDSEFATLSPRITDFGLAKLDADAAQITQTGTLVGTPAYMSPEQTRGAGDSGQSSDIYALGAMLYELITHKQPFTESSVLELIKKIQTHDPVAPSKIRADVPRDLEAVCLKCLEKDPSKRYLSAYELQTDLQRFRDGYPVDARPVTTMDRMARWAKRNPALTIAYTATLVFLIAALAATSIGWFSTSSALGRESLARKEARSAVNDFFVEVESNQLLNVPGLTPLRHELLRMALVYYQGFLSASGDDDELVEEVERAHFRAGQILIELGQPAQALEQYQLAINRQDDQLAADVDNQSTFARKMITLNHVAEAQSDLGNLDDAMTLVDEALEGHWALRADEPENTNLAHELANALELKAKMRKQIGEAETSTNLLRDASVIRRLLIGIEPDNAEFKRRFAANLVDLANSMAQGGQLVESEPLLDEAINLFRDLLVESPGLPQDQQRLQGALFDRAVKHFRQGQFAEARPLLEEASDLGDDLCSRYPNVAQYQQGRAKISSGIGFCYMRLGMADEALDAFAANTEAAEQIALAYPDIAERKMDLAVSKLNLASALGQHRDDPTEVRRHLHDVIEICTELLQQNPQLLNARIANGNAELNLAANYLSDRQFEQALQHADRSIDFLTVLNQENPNHPQIKPSLPVAHKNRGVALENLQRFPESIAAWQQAIDVAAPKKQIELKVRLSSVLAMADQAAQAYDLLQTVGDLSSGQNDVVFELGRARALITAAWVRAGNQNQTEIDDMAKSAVESLELARQQGKFQKPKAIERLQESADFDSLRDRDDFQTLVERVVTDAPLSSP